MASFIFNPAKEVVTETEDRTILRYIRGSELIARNTDAVRTYYHYASDEMGNITHVTDEEGNILNRYEYDAWGNLTLEEEQVSNRLKYTGEQFDAITQQYYLCARFYNPALARFIQEDTYRGDGLNLYVYCANNPVRYVDPSGHEKTVSFSDKFEGHVAEEIAFAKEHGVFVYYDTPLANKVNEMIRQNQTQIPKADMPNDGRRGERVSSTIHNDILDSPRTGSALKVDEIKPTYAVDPKTGRAYMVQEFPAGAQAHGFNNIVDNYAGYATKTSIENGVLYQLEGLLNGVSGRFEWIIQDGQVTHRMFIQNGTMNGVPIKP